MNVGDEVWVYRRNRWHRGVIIKIRHERLGDATMTVEYPVHLPPLGRRKTTEKASQLAQQLGLFDAPSG